VGIDVDDRLMRCTSLGEASSSQSVYLPKRAIKNSHCTMNLTQLKCLVTGASSGIGKATCELLTKYGACVVGTGRNEKALRSLKEAGSILDFVVADITEEGECQRVVERAVQMLTTATPSLGGLTTVVNACGVLQGGAMGTVGIENYHYNMKANTQSTFEIMVHAIPHLKEKKHLYPSIINVSSVTGKQSFENCAAYCMSKAALDQLTRCASVDLAKDGIRVNAVNPGVVETNLHKAGGMQDEQYSAFLKRSIETTHPLAASLGRVAQPNDVAELIAFLASDKAQFMTGECIAIDGGRQNLGAR
jgi:NAD(P)-dependent dehydrogenase (short-subunit alcohol dehydrogenase family)